MWLIHTEKLSVGMEIGEPVYGASGQMLLAPGVKLSQRYINLLRELNVPATYVSDPDTADVQVPRPIGPKTRSKACGALAEAFEHLGPATKQLREQAPIVSQAQASSEKFEKTVRAIFGGGGFDALVRSVESVIGDLQSQRVLVGLNTIKSHDAYTFQHSIDVTIMGVVLARRAGWDSTRVRLFGIGCMLHDIGKVLIPEEILRKPGRLTEEEFQQMQQHPELGYHLVKSIAPSLGGLVPQVAYQHHERQDGSGYPRGLKGSNTMGCANPGMIHDFGSLCAVADVYDAMASTRPYRKAWAPDQVVANVIGSAGEHLNREAVNVFRSVVAPYPVCSEVTIMSGSHAGKVGIVVEVDANHLAQPRVRVLRAADGSRIDPIEIDLRKDPEVTIRSATASDELPAESMGSRRKAPPPPPEPLPPEVVVAIRETHQVDDDRVARENASYLRAKPPARPGGKAA